jgi:hypothetical protein
MDDGLYLAEYPHFKGIEGMLKAVKQACIDGIVNSQPLMHSDLTVSELHAFLMVLVDHLWATQQKHIYQNDSRFNWNTYCITLTSTRVGFEWFTLETSAGPEYQLTVYEHQGKFTGPRYAIFCGVSRSANSEFD